MYLDIAHFRQPRVILQVMYSVTWKRNNALDNVSSGYGLECLVAFLY